MDETKTYIKMSDCPEIQGQKPKGGTQISCSLREDLHISKYGDYWAVNKHLSWLPRQGDIQKMMGYSNPVLAMEPFVIYRSSNQWNHFKTWEQLWLAFYMWEHHKKIWNGKGWVAKES